jgi:hypothetical protein
MVLIIGSSMEDHMRGATIPLTLAFLFLLTGSLMAMHGPTSTVRLNDLIEQSSAYQIDNPGFNGKFGLMFSEDNSAPDGDYTTEDRADEERIRLSDANMADEGNMVLPPTPVPEPTTLILLGLGMAGAAILRRKK